MNSDPTEEDELNGIDWWDRRHDASGVRFRMPPAPSWRTRLADVFASAAGWLAWKTFEIADAIRGDAS